MRHKIGRVWGQSQRLAADVFFEHIAVWGMPQSPNGFLFDLSDTLPSELELLTDFFEREWIFHANTEVRADDIGFTRGQCRKGALDFNAERFTHQTMVWTV